jgi:uncharacterized membrane protein
MKKSEKFKSITFNNRKKQFTCTYTTGKRIILHYGQLGIHQTLVNAWVDRETRNRSIGIELADGVIDYIPFDQPLALVKDPEFLLRTHIEVLTARIKQELKKQKISKRYLAKSLETSDNQVQRLLNPNILNKNLEQLYKVASILRLEFEIVLKEAA